MGNTTASLTHEQLFGGATIEKTGLGIKLAALSIAICMTLTGCGQTTAGSSSTGGTTSNEKSYSARQEDTQVLKRPRWRCQALKPSRTRASIR